MNPGDTPLKGNETSNSMAASSPVLKLHPTGMTCQQAQMGMLNVGILYPAHVYQF